MRPYLKFFVSTSFALLLAVIPFASAQELFIYDNTDNNSGQTYMNGGAEVQAGNTITRMVGDDITPIPGYVGMPIVNVYFSVVNNNGAAVSARPRIRFYGSDGTGGGPGTLITGFSFNPISFNPGNSFFFFTPTGMTVPNGTFWIGMTYDNNTGGTGATLGQMNNMGMALFNPPTIGTSADTYFQTTAAGSFFASNPVGTLGNFGGNPPANFYFGMSVPEPSIAALLSLGGMFGLALLRRRNEK